MYCYVILPFKFILIVTQLMLLGSELGHKDSYAHKHQLYCYIHPTKTITGYNVHEEIKNYNAHPISGKYHVMDILQ